MKVKGYVHILIDAEGNQCHDISKDCGDWICVGGKDSQGNYQQFDSCEAWHCYGFAERHGMKFTSIPFESEVKLNSEFEVANETD